MLAVRAGDEPFPHVRVIPFDIYAGADDARVTECVPLLLRGRGIEASLVIFDNILLTAVLFVVNETVSGNHNGGFLSPRSPEVNHRLAYLLLLNRVFIRDISNHARVIGNNTIDLASNKILCLQSILEGKGVFLKKIGRFVKPAAGFNVVATANTKGKGSDDGRFIGTNVLNEAFLERFPVTFEQSYPSPSTQTTYLALS